MKAVDQLEQIDLRRRRADYFTAAVFEEIKDLIPDDEKPNVHQRLLRLFHENGACIMTDEDRAKEGLEPRDAKGWTPSERIQQKQMKAQALYALQNIVVDPGEQSS